MLDSKIEVNETITQRIIGRVIRILGNNEKTVFLVWSETKMFFPPVKKDSQLDLRKMLKNV